MPDRGSSRATTSDATSEVAAAPSALCALPAPVSPAVPDAQEAEAERLRTQRLQSVGTLASGIAHDVNNALLPILFGAELLKTNPDRGDRAHLLDQIARNAERAKAILRQILMFVGKIHPNRERLDLLQVLRGVHEMIVHTFPKTLHIKTAFATDLWSVMGDETQLSQVFMNLCINARDAMGDNGDLILSTGNVVLSEEFISRYVVGGRPGPYVYVRVEDTGPGISPEIMDKIFDPFFTTKGVGKGTGLGLSMSLGIVKTHGGFLNVKSQPGKGAAFTVYLPATNELPEPRREPNVAVPMGHGETILIVDDEGSIRDLIRASLEGASYRVITASSGSDAFSAMRHSPAPIGAVICDLMMPDMTGAEAIREFRRLDPNLPVIAMSGLIEDKAAEAKAAGARCLLQKPFTGEVLLRTLDLFVRSRAKSGG